MNLQTLRDEVRTRVHELTADFFGDSEIDRAINEGVVRFCAEERWPWLYTEGTGSLALDDDELILPTNVALNRFFNLSISGSTLSIPVELERVTPDAGFRLRHRYSTATGRPQYYYVSSALTDTDDTDQVTYTVKLAPAADGDYDLEYQYVRPPVTMQGANDQPDLPPEYHEAVAAWATGHLFLKELQVSQKADEQFALYSKVLAQARQDIFSPSQDEIVAWGRYHPGEYYIPEQEIWRRIPPTIGT